MVDSKITVDVLAFRFYGSFVTARGIVYATVSTSKIFRADSNVEFARSRLRIPGVTRAC